MNLLNITRNSKDEDKSTDATLKELEIRHIQRDLYVNERNGNNVNVQCCEIF